MLYTVTMPVECGMPRTTLSGLGTFVAGEPRELELVEAQVRSLRARYFIVIAQGAEPAAAVARWARRRRATATDDDQQPGEPGQDEGGTAQRE